MLSSDSSVEFSHPYLKHHKTRPQPTDHMDTTINTRYSTKLDNPRDTHKTNTTVRSPSRKRSASKKKKAKPVEGQSNKRSKSKSFDGKSSLKIPKQTTAEVARTPLKKDRPTLKKDAGELQQTVLDQSKKLKKLYKSVVGKRREINQLTEQLLSSRKKTRELLDLEEKVKALEDNEQHLMEYLKEQQKLAKEALGKLYELQEESMSEIEKAKEYYKDFYQTQAREDREQFEHKLKRVEADKEKLLVSVRELETTLSVERSSNTSSILAGEVAVLKSQLNEKSIEIERIKFENRELKLSVDENKKLSSLEVKGLKQEVEALLEQNRILKSNMGDTHNRETHATYVLKRSIEDLEQQLYEKDQAMHEKDMTYKEQLGHINEKVVSLQGELKMLTEYEEKIDGLTKDAMFKDEELQMVKKYYKEKLQKAKAMQKNQKDEWANIYNELLSEIKQLKVEIDTLGLENRRLASSVHSGGTRHHF